MIWQRISFLLLLIFYSFNSVDLLSQYPIILIVSYDGFRFDYLSKGANPVLNGLRKSGTFAEYLHNVFVTKTYPNHFSIVTGLYPESHGVLGKSLYDSYYKKKLGYDYELWHCFNETIPIWIANEKKGNGRYSGVMMWPGCEFEYGGIKPTHVKPWDYNVTFDKRVDLVIKWILDPVKPANLLLLYIEEPDYHGHRFGVDSPHLKDELKVMDNTTRYILNKLDHHNLTNHVNLFFLSDHGMISVTKKNIIDFRKFVPSDLYDLYDGSPGLHIYPKPGKANIVYNGLKKAINKGSKFSIYKGSEIPSHWHFKNNRRAPPIFVLADPPHVFHDFYATIKLTEKLWNFTATDDTAFGVHGYDTKYREMKPYFVAVGPDIKKGYQIEPFKVVDLFALWSHMSGFPEYADKTNGSLNIVGRMLRVPKLDLNDDDSRNIGSIFLRLFLIGIVINVAVYFLYKKWYFRRKKKDYLGRLSLSEEPLESRQRLLDDEEET